MADLKYDELEPERLAHIELIQTTVGRLAGNSFFVKGWAITVAGAFFVFALHSHSWRLATAAVVPIAAFWFLDAYFLRAERLPSRSKTGAAALRPLPCP